MDVAQQIPHRLDLQNEFGDIQFCGAAFGTERKQNAMNIHLTTRSELTYSSSDYEDAYYHADRSKILSGIARVIPALLPPIHRRLEAVQDVIYFGSESGPATIKQAVGLTQGQATSGQLYSLGIHPLNKELSALALQHNAGLLSAYIDDVKTHSTAELIAGIISTQQTKGPKYGAKLKMEKHKILLEVCGDDLQARSIQSYFHDTFRIPLDRIQIHPDNIADPVDKAEARLRYGDVILGIPASPFPEFIDAFVSTAVEEISCELRLASQRLKNEPHHLWYLLKHILAAKFT